MLLWSKETLAEYTTILSFNKSNVNSNNFFFYYQILHFFKGSSTYKFMTIETFFLSDDVSYAPSFRKTILLLCPCAKCRSELLFSGYRQTSKQNQIKTDTGIGKKVFVIYKQHSIVYRNIIVQKRTINNRERKIASFIVLFFCRVSLVKQKCLNI